MTLKTKPKQISACYLLFLTGPADTVFVTHSSAFMVRWLALARSSAGLGDSENPGPHEQYCSPPLRAPVLPLKGCLFSPGAIAQDLEHSVLGRQQVPDNCELFTLRHLQASQMGSAT